MATNPLLVTKLRVPPLRPHLVARPRLTARLNDALTRPLTLVSAPPGFGKTTVLTEWLEQQSLPVGWYSLDERDNDISRFLAYLVGALETVQVKVESQVLTRMRSHRRPALDSLMAVVNNDIAAAEHEFVLVLDDFHVVESPDVHRAVEVLVDQLPAPLHLVIATRADPPFPLTRLRARGQLLELRMADLRFSAGEAAAFLNGQMGLNLTAAQVAALDARAEGWIAGLQLAALSMQGRTDVAGFIDAFTGSHHFVLDYLAEEVLQRQPPEIQSFLLQTSILDQMNAPLADAVTGRSDSLKVLGQLEKANLFLVPLDDARQWYRYHHLFDDLLQGWLQQSSPDQVPELHRRASAWLEQNGFMNEAVDHALAARDYDRVLQLIEACGLILMMRSEDTTILRWIEQLPEELVWSHHFLNLVYATALLSVGKVELSTAHLAQVDVEQLNPLARALAETIRVFLGMDRGNLAQTIQSLEAVLEAKGIGPGTEPRDHFEIVVTLYFWVLIAYLQVAAGKLREAAASCRRGLEIANALRLASPWVIVVGFIQTVLADILYEWNELEAAQQSAVQGLEVSRAERNGEFETYALLDLALIRAAQGDEAAALDAAQQSLTLTRKRNVTVEMGYVSTKLIRALVTLGRVEDASQLLEEFQMPWGGPGGGPAEQTLLEMPEPFTFFTHSLLMSRPRVGIAQGQFERAALSLQWSLEHVLAESESGTAIEALSLLALAQQGRGEKELAVATLKRALALAQPEKYVRTFVDGGPAMRDLISAYRQQARAAPGDERISEYADELLSAFASANTSQETRPTAFAQTPARSAAALAEPLSERERSVLQLIDKGLSNQEIAERLVVAVSTVKTHINNIYGKLGVANRTQALARARELGIL